MTDRDKKSLCEPTFPFLNGPNGPNPLKRRRPKREAVITKQVSPQEAQHRSDVHHIGKGTYYQAQIRPSASCGKDAKRVQNERISSSPAYASGERATIQPVMELRFPNEENPEILDCEQRRKVSVDANRRAEEMVDLQSLSSTESPERSIGSNPSANPGDKGNTTVIRPIIDYDPQVTDQDSEEIVINNQSFRLRRLNSDDEFEHGEIAQIFAWCRDKDGKAHYLLTMQNNTAEVFLVPRGFFNAKSSRGNALANFYQSFLKAP